MKSFLETWKIIEAEELGTNKPVPLSKITPQLAQVAVASGKKDNNEKDDKAQGAKKDEEVAVGALLPMQKEVIPMKALGMALQYLLGRFDKLTNMEAIVSSDNYIMDGHHRWAAATLINPNTMVKVTRIGIPAAQLITALNIWTKAEGKSGKPGKGDISQFATAIPSLIDEVMNKGIPDQTDKNTGGVVKGLTTDEIKQAFAKLGNGDANVGANLMKENAAKLPTQKHPNAPERVDMPVVEGQKEIDDVVNRLLRGDIDWNFPLSKDTEIAKNTNKTNIAAPQQNVNMAAKPVTQNVGGVTQPVQKPASVQPTAQQRQVASTLHSGNNLNECLILAGIKK